MYTQDVYGGQCCVACVACIPVFPADATTPRHATPRTRGLLEVWLGLVRFVDEFDATSC